MKNQTSEPTFGGVKYSASLGTLISADGNPIDLRKQCIDVFRCLAANPGSLVNKEDIVGNVWGTVAVTDDSVVQCISEIRRAEHAAERRDQMISCLALNCPAVQSLNNNAVTD